jgi:class 3 adenylate cyclase
VALFQRAKARVEGLTTDCRFLRCMSQLGLQPASAPISPRCARAVSGQAAAPLRTEHAPLQGDLCATFVTEDTLGSVERSMPENASRRLAAILAADIAGYSALVGSDEARTVGDLKGHQAVASAQS